jgi:hypothetical protein
MESHMQNRFSGVTVDFYDDLGGTLKARFPSRDDLPDVVKTASIQPKEKLANEQFALVMVDQGHAFRKFACNDAGTTAMSAIYFMEHGDKLPLEAQKTAAAYITRALISHDLQPPEAMLKLTEPIGKEKLADVIDITGRRPPTKIKEAAPVNDDDYAVVMDDGSRYYPIHTWDLMKTAESYYHEEQRRMHPEIRRQFATKLAAKADLIGFPLDQNISEQGATTYANAGHLQAALEMRKVACEPGKPREFLDGLFEKHAELDPSTYAEVLRRFDVEQGLDHGWDHLVLDPWASTFGIDKTAEVIWEDGADRVTDKAMINLADNHLDIVTEEFTDHMSKEFKTDPLGVFRSMPTPQKRLLARMAMDSESVGGSEHGFTG